MHQIFHAKNAVFFCKKRYFAAWNQKFYVVTPSYLLAGVSFATGFSVAGAILFVIKIKMKVQIKRLQGILEYESLLKETLKKEQETLLQHGMDREGAMQKKCRESEMARDELKVEVARWQTEQKETAQKAKSLQEDMQALKLKLIEAQNTIVRIKAQMEKTT